MTTISDIRSGAPISFPLEKTVSSKEKTVVSTVSLSKDAELLAKAEEQLKRTPEVDEEKVEAIKQAIAKGELTIDFDRLAQKMLEFEISLSD